jgi:transposase-like protein
MLPCSATRSADKIASNSRRNELFFKQHDSASCTAPNLSLLRIPLSIGDFHLRARMDERTLVAGVNPMDCLILVQAVVILMSSAPPMLVTGAHPFRHTKKTLRDCKTMIRSRQRAARHLEEISGDSRVQRILAARLDRALRQSGMTSSKAARQLGVSENEVLYWRRGITTPHNQAPRSKLRGMNCAFPGSRFSTGLRHKRRGIRPEEIEQLEKLEAMLGAQEARPLPLLDALALHP